MSASTVLAGIVVLSALLTGCSDPVRNLQAAGHEIHHEGEALILSLMGPGNREEAIAARGLPRLKEIRTLGTGGASVEFLLHLGDLPDVKQFGVHYGMTPEAIERLDQFPNLEILTFWGRPSHLLTLPLLPKLRVLHCEETELTLEDIHAIARCRNLEEFHCDGELSSEALGILKEMPQLARISSENYTAGWD